MQLVYTGTICGEPDAPTLLGTLDLAHRWQISHVVMAVERALALMITGENFGELCETALLKELPVLRTACLRFALSHTGVRERLDQGEFGEVVTHSLGLEKACAADQESSLSQTKRRRKL